MKSIALIFCFLSSTLSAQVIPFSENEDGNIIIISKFNDSIQANMIFDTGGGLNVISNRFFQKIKNSAVFQHYFTGFRHDGDRIDFEIYKIPALSVGNFKLKNVLVGVTSLLDQWNMDGVISLINFTEQPITIDFDKRELRIETSASMKSIKATNQSIQIKVHRFEDISLDIFAPVCIRGEKLDMEFDTGSLPDDILINSKFLNRLDIDTTLTRNENCYTPFSRQQFRQYIAKIDSINFCDLRYEPIKNVRVEFKQGLIYDGIIGAGYFKKLPITFDISAQKMWVKIN